MSIYTESEMEVINNVIQKFKDISCTKISEESHKEPGWINNNINDMISYDYANELKMTFK
jgi:hypothetical protein